MILKIDIGINNEGILIYWGNMRAQNISEKSLGTIGYFLSIQYSSWQKLIALWGKFVFHTHRNEKTYWLDQAVPWNWRSGYGVPNRHRASDTVYCFAEPACLPV